MFFDGFQSLGRTLIVGMLAYVSVVFLLRISGRRTLSKMNAFDFIVTVALGSVLATMLLSKSVSLATGVMAFAVLIGLQFAVTWTSVRFQWVEKTVTGEPVMLLFKGNLLSEALRKARVTDNEIRAAIRSAGLAHIEDAEAVILETDGSFSVIKSSKGSGESSLHGVKGADSRGLS